MDLLKTHKRRSRLSEFAYIALNVAFAVALLLLIRGSQSPWLALTVVLLSKWRTFAVRPRFWFANIVANLVDVTVGVSIVALLYAADGSLPLQIVITFFYIFWLLFIKPRSKRSYVAAQAGIAVFLGITSLSIISYSWNVFFFVLLMWVLGYIAARHVLGSYDEPRTVLYSLLTGFMFAEIGWISFHWLMAYQVTGFGAIQLSQLALFTTLLCFVAERGYASYNKHGTVKRNDIIMPISLTASIMVAVFIMAIIFGSDAL